MNSWWLFRVGPRCRSQQQDCRKLQSQIKIIGHAWVLRVHITVNELYAESDWTAAGPEGDVENEDIISEIETSLQTLFGVQFENLSGKSMESYLE